MIPEWLQAAFAGITLLILWSTTIIGAAVWLMNQLKKVKEEILSDFDQKHKANDVRYDDMYKMVIKHEVILNPEFRVHVKNPDA